MLMTMYTGGGYSSDIEVGVEKVVGTITIDGTKYTRYVKVIDFGALPDSTTKSIAHGISSYVGILSIEGVSNRGDMSINIPNISTASLTDAIGIYIDPTNINVITGRNYSTYINTYITIEYYK